MVSFAILRQQTVALALQIDCNRSIVFACCAIIAVILWPLIFNIRDNRITMMDRECTCEVNTRMKEREDEGQHTLSVCRDAGQRHTHTHTHTYTHTHPSPHPRTNSRQQHCQLIWKWLWNRLDALGQFAVTECVRVLCKQCMDTKPTSRPPAHAHENHTRSWFSIHTQRTNKVNRKRKKVDTLGSTKSPRTAQGCPCVWLS